VNVAEVAELPGVEESKAVPLEEAGGPRPIRAVYTGMPPIATAVQSELMATLRESAMYAIPALAVVMMFVAWNAVGGLLATLAILFPAAVVLGVLGWTGVDIDMGILLIAGVALGVALDATVSFVAWMRRGADAGLFRTEAARMAYCRVAPGMLDATLIGGLGLLAMAASGVTISQQFGLAAIGVMAAAMAGSLVVLPAMAASPLGRFFGAEAAPAEGALTLAPVKVEVPRATEPAARPGRADVAAAAGPSAPHRAKPGVTADDRQEVAEGPHSALHAKLQRLRRSGDSSAP
jgi:predicted RND superfamily exporter protein